MAIERTSNSTHTVNTSTDSNLLVVNGVITYANGAVFYDIGSNVQNLAVFGNTSINTIVANNSMGMQGQVLTTNGIGTGIYWSTVSTPNTVVMTAGDGLYQNATHYYVNANTGIVANSLGTFVNAAYIATTSSNSATYIGNSTAAASYTNITNWISGNAATAYTNAATLAGTAYTNAAAYADTKSATAYSNATSYADTKAGTAYTNAAAYADSKAGIAYSNAITYSIADATARAATAYTNAVATAASDASTKAATAYANAVANASALYQTTAGLSANVATLTSNMAIYHGNSSGTIANVASWITGNAATAYTNATSYASTIAGTAYTNAVAAAATDATTKSNAAYTNAVATAAADATTKSNAAYANAVANAAALYQTTAGLSANVATLTANAATYLGNSATTGANVAAWITGNAATAYTNATSYAATIAGTAYSNAVATAASDASTKAATAYANAVANASALYAPLAGATFTGQVTAPNVTTSSNTLTIGSAAYFIASGNFGIGTNAPTNKLQVFGGQVNIQKDNTAKVGLLLGPKNPVLQVLGGPTNENDPGAISIVTPSVGSSSSRGSELYFMSSRANTTQLSTSVFSPLLVNDAMGKLIFGGDNGVTLRQSGAAIQGVVASTWSATNAEGYLIFQTTQNGSNSPATRMSIWANGSVNMDYNLTVSGTGYFGGTLAGGNTTITGFVNVTTNTATFGTAAYHVANGNFGIGTSAPQAKLHVIGTSQFADPTIVTVFQISPNTTGTQLSSYTAAGSFLSLATGNSTSTYEWARIVSNGNFGIGTSAPAASLDVYGKASIDSLNVRDSSGTSLMRITTAGDIIYGRTSPGPYIYSPSDFRFSSAGSFRYTVDAGVNYNAQIGSTTFFNMGNVGIGNTSPDAKLAVTGTANISGAVILGSTLATGNTTITGFANVSANVYVGNSTVYTYTNATSFSGTSNNSINLGGYTWAAPGTIGSGTANSGAFTTLTTTQRGVANTASPVSGQAVAYDIMQGGRSYYGYDFNSYASLYEARFVNMSVSSNMPAGMTAATGYWFGMGAGDTASRGFDLFGSDAQQFWFRARAANTWVQVITANNAHTLNGVLTYTANIFLASGNATNQLLIGTINATSSGLLANSTVLTVGNNTVNTTINATSFSGTANNSLNLGGSSLATVQGQITGNAATAYTNAVSTAAADATTKSNAAYTNAVATAASDATTKSNAAYANAVANAAALYQTTAGLSANVATLTSNMAIYLGNSSGTIANVASWITGNAATAYTNATSYAATIAGTAYTNAVATAATDASTKAATAYTNATTFAANASNISNGTLAEPRLPYRMDQNVTTANSVTFNNITLTGNLYVNGQITTVAANNLSITDNMIYLNNGIETVITNVTGNGSYVVFTANNNYGVGWDVVVTNVNPTSYNGTYLNIFAVNATSFTVANTNTATYVSGGAARGKTDVNPDIGFAAGYNDGTYHHTGFFRRAADNRWYVFNNYDPEPDTSIYIDVTNTSFKVADLQANAMYLGNTTVYGTVNSTIYTGAANAATYLGNSATTGANVASWITGNAATAYTNATSYADTKAATAYSNATSFATTIAGTAYTNAVATAASDATSKAATAYANAVANAAALYQTTAGLAANVATLTANAATYLGNSATTGANVASWITGNAATAYTNATSYASTIAGTAYTNAVATAATDASTKAATAYTNATVFAANASNINTGTLAEARLPYRMNQNVTTANSVVFNSLSLSSNLTVNGSITAVGDPKIVFSVGNTTTNTDILVRTYTAASGTLSFEGTAGQLFSITNDLSGVLFSVNDVSGIPSMEVYANGDIRLGEFSGNVSIGTANNSAKLFVNGNTYVNGTILVGGTVLNSTVYSGTSNNALYLGGTLASGYQTTAGLAANVLTLSANLATYLGNSATTGANVASWITGNSATAYTNAVSTAATDASTKAATAYTNATSYADTKAAAAYANAVANAAALYQTTAGLAANVATLTSNNATNFNGVSSATYTESLRANRNISGGGTITVDSSGNIYWTSRFIIFSNGRGTNFATDGYYDIICPTSGTITGVGGAANVTATGAGINLTAYYALYYILPIGSVSGSVAANFRIVASNSDLDIPHNWVLICAFNNDNGIRYFNNGVSLKAGTSFDTTTWSSTLVPTSNNATNLNGQAASYYTNATNINAGTLGNAYLPSAISVNSINAVSVMIYNAANTAKFNTLTTDVNGYVSLQNIAVGTSIGAGSGYWGGFNAGLYLGNSSVTGLFFTSGNNAGVTGLADTGIYRIGVKTLAIGNNTLGDFTGSLKLDSITFANATVSATINNNTYSGTSNNALSLGGTLASGYQTTAGLSANVLTLTSNNSTNFGGYTWASPGALGTTAANSGNFTTVNATSYTVGSNFVANTTGITTTGFASITGNTSTNNIAVATKLNVGTAVGYNFGTLAVIEIDSSQNTYVQAVIQNANSGVNASADLVVTNDTGNDTFNYVDFGINSSTYSNSLYTVVGASDGYLYASNGALGIGTATAKDIIFHANGTLTTNEKMRISANGFVGVGTSAPVSTLDVRGVISTIALAGRVEFLQATSGTGFRWSLNNDGTFRVQSTADGFATVSSTPLLIAASGNTGIGNTTPDAKLAVTGTANISGAVVLGSTLTSGNITSTSIQVGNATSYFIGNELGISPVSNTLGNAFGNTVSRWNITAGTGTFSGAGTFSNTFTHDGATGNYGSATIASTYQLGYGATTTGVLKTINIGTGGAAGSTTNVNIGSTLSNTFVTINANTATVTGAITLTRINPRIGTVANTATITPTADVSDQYNVTALGIAATIAVPSGTPVDGQKLTIRIKDNGTARALTWTTSAGGYRVVGTTLPTTTVISKTVYVGCIYNSADTFWDVIAVAQQA